MSNGPLQYTGQWLIDQLQQLRNVASADWARISTMNGRLITLLANTNKLPSNSPIKDQLYRSIIRLKAQQVANVRDYNDGAGRLDKFMAQAQTWLREHGYSTSGLGVAPVVIGGAIVVGAFFIATVAALWEWHRQNDRKAQDQENKAGAVEQLMAAYKDGKLTPQQMAELFAQINNSGAGSGTDKLIADLTPIAAIGLGVWLITKLFAPRPAAA